MMELAWSERDSVRDRCIAFEADLAARATALAGESYASLLALSWRHAIAAHKLAAGPAGEPLLFSKENFSNGCIATVDVTYPSAPMFLAFNPSLIRAMLDPYFPYCAGPDWPFPFAAHDLGTYPLANGQTYRNWDKDKTLDIIETQMPVEECGNMLILVGALARAEGNASYASQHWTLLTQWADYLVETGLQPGRPALHRRFLRRARPQREPLRQGRDGPRLLCPDGRHARPQGGGGALSRRRRGVRLPYPQVPRRRGHAARLRPARLRGASSTTSSGTGCSG